MEWHQSKTGTNVEATYRCALSSQADGKEMGGAVR